MNDFKYSLGDIFHFDYVGDRSLLIKCEIIGLDIYYSLYQDNFFVYNIKTLKSFEYTSLKNRTKIESGATFSNVVEQHLLPVDELNTQQDNSKGNESPQDYFRKIMAL